MKAKEATTWNDIEVLVIGAGTMGASIAQAYAQSGFPVGLLDIDKSILEKALDTIGAELDAARGRIFSSEQIDSIRERILMTTDYAEACSGQALKIVIESATERLDIKQKIFSQLEKHCAPHVIFASNSSSLDIDVIAAATGRPEKVVWMHYFYLPHKNRAGEYAGSSSATDESKRLAALYLKLAGKIPTPILSSRRGGAADIVFVSLLLEAVRMREEGYDVPTIEAAGKLAYGMPVGFLGLMDITGLEVGLYAMKSFSEKEGEDDELIKAYGNFFTPPKLYYDLVQHIRDSEDKGSVRWVSENDAAAQATDQAAVDNLKDRFLGIGFMTSAEVIDSGIIEIAEFELLAQNAFLWREGPFTIMNKLGIEQSYSLVEKRAELAAKYGHDFPIPSNLQQQAESGKPWPIGLSPVIFTAEASGKIARITLSNPKAANAMDNTVFAELERHFTKANEDDSVKVIVFDTAPIKTFIAGANVPDFVRRIKEGAFEAIRDDTAKWQDVMFHIVTGTTKPKIAIVDGQAFGGGVEFAMALADDPYTIVLATERTSYTLPETRLGIYPGLRGTLLLPRLIHRTTDDAELAVAMARYYILAGGTTTTSPRMLHYFGLADLLIPAHRREDAITTLAQAIMDGGGKLPSPEQIQNLNIEKHATDLTFAEKEEIRAMKDLFLQPDLLATLAAYARGQAEIFVAGEHKAMVQRIARRVYFNSPHATFISNLLISQGFADITAGVDIEDVAKSELDEYLIPTFRHPDALEGLSAMLERRFPNFNRRYPF